MSRPSRNTACTRITLSSLVAGLLVVAACLSAPQSPAGAVVAVPVADPLPAAGPGPAAAHASHLLAAPGVTFDPAKIPAGSPGSTAWRVRRTGELPTPSDIGNFRTVCLYSHMNTDDPIVFPGQQGASHLHTYWGNTLTDFRSTAGSIRSSGAGTCRGGRANRTAYWVPAVIDTRTSAPLAPELIHVYYKSGYFGLAPSQIQPMPTGLRMVAGDPRASSGQPFTGWKCWDGAALDSSRPIPRCAVGDHVAMTIDFPQCWNGRTLDSADHRSHMAYPVAGRCPASHPVAIPVISYNVLYPVTAASDTAAWRLSSDTYPTSLPGGYSIHADWFDGWAVGIKNTWVTGCVRVAVSCGSHMLGDGRVIEGDA